MTLLFDGENAFFAERTPASPHALVLHLPEKSSLFLNGICFFPKDNDIKIPQGVLHLGKNVLALRIENRLFPTESLYYDGKTVLPDGLPRDAMLLKQHKRADSLEQSIASLEARIAHLEQKSIAHTLFS